MQTILLTAHEAVAQTNHRLQALYAKRQRGVPLGPKTEMAKLDTLMNGHFCPGLHSLLGGTGKGKSTLAWQWAVQCGVPALYVTTEMTVETLIMRHTAMMTRTMAGKLLSYGLPYADVLALQQAAMPSMEHIRILPGVGQPISISELRTALDACRNADGNVFVIIDSFHKWAIRTYEHDQEVNALAEAFLDLLEMADVEQAPILLIGEKSLAKSHENKAESGAGSRRLAYDPCSVFNLDTKHEDGKGPVDWQTDPFTPREMVLHISKQRNGVSGVTLPLYHFGAFACFSENPNEDMRRRQMVVSATSVPPPAMPCSAALGAAYDKGDDLL